jgi:hypothetical protein
MNIELLQQIVRHVFASFGIIRAGFKLNGKSLSSPEYLLPDVISFEIDGEIKRNKTWGCQLSSADNELKVLLADCSETEGDNKDYALLIQLKNCPAYGLYWTQDKRSKIPGEPLIACSVDTGWLECNTYLQAMFLAGIEQTKDIGLVWNKCQDYKKQLDLLKSFIQFHDAYYEEDAHEGQEDRF